MKVEVEVYFDEYKNKIKRDIIVNDNISIEDFCEFIITSLNGSCKEQYYLEVNNDEYKCFLGLNCEYEDDSEEFMNDKTLKYLSLKKEDKLLLVYGNFDDWEIRIDIKNILKGYNEKGFEVIDGYGVGILESFPFKGDLKKLLKPTKNELDYCSYRCPEFIEYRNAIFDVNENNMKIDDYIERKIDFLKPRNYIMNISLEEYGREIKRKVSVDSDISLNSFCRCVVKSMKGDLSHYYTIKKGKEYLDEYIINTRNLRYLELKEKEKLKVIYDFGDNWKFNITVSKIMVGYGNKKFELLSGKGYGIIDDCGGTYGLYEIFSGENEDWGKCDIEEFNIDELRKEIDKEL